MVVAEEKRTETLHLEPGGGIYESIEKTGICKV
jgi:hypothetical protein